MSSRITPPPGVKYISANVIEEDKGGRVPSELSSVDQYEFWAYRWASAVQTVQLAITEYKLPLNMIKYEWMDMQNGKYPLPLYQNEGDLYLKESLRNV